MAGVGNSYQHVILHVLDWMNRTGEHPRDLSDLARQSGLNEAEIRRSFPSVAALQTGLVHHGIVLLSDVIGSAASKVGSGDPVAQLNAMARAFFTWGSQNRSLFNLLAKELAAPEVAGETNMDLYRNSLRALVMRKLVECRDKGVLAPDTDLEVLIATIHCQILGISSMLVLDRKDTWYHGECDHLGDLAMRIMDQFLDRIFPPR